MKLRWPSLLIALNIVAALAVVGIAARFVFVPVIARHVYQERYKALVFQCDDVMRAHFIAKARVMRALSEETIQNLRAAEVSLLSCHDYDKLRKRLLILGVTEDELAALGLDAIEHKARDVRPFVETHEIRY